MLFFFSFFPNVVTLASVATASDGTATIVAALIESATKLIVFYFTYKHYHKDDKTDSRPSDEKKECSPEARDR